MNIDKMREVIRSKESVIEEGTKTNQHSHTVYTGLAIQIAIWRVGTEICERLESIADQVNSIRIEQREP